jgi:hypothetical protein
MATKKQAKKPGSGPMIGLMAVGICGLAALAAYVKFGGADKVPDEIRKVPNLQQSAGNKDSANDSKVQLVTPSRDGEDLKLGKHESDVPAGEDPRLFALNHFLRESKIVPDDAKVVGIEVKDGLALVDVSPSFNQTYGTFDEEALLKGIRATLAQFKDIDKVQFFVEGKVVSTLGNVDLSEPIPVRENPNEGSSAS